MAAPPQGVLPDTAADLVDNLSAESHNVEGVEDRDGARELVADRVGVAAEQVERGVFDRGDELSGRPSP